MFHGALPLAGLAVHDERTFTLPASEAPQPPPVCPADSRAMRSFSKQAYTSGVVIIKCPECGSRHLIADRLGWFGDSASVETILKEKGQGACPLLWPQHIRHCLRCLFACTACCRLTAVCLLRRCAMA